MAIDTTETAKLGVVHAPRFRISRKLNDTITRTATERFKSPGTLCAEVLSLLQEAGPLSFMSVHVDGRLCVSVHFENTVNLYDADGLDCVKSLSVVDYLRQYVNKRTP